MENNKAKVSVIIAAAGRGERAGFGKNKLLRPLWGAPVLWHTLKKFAFPGVDEVVIASSPRDAEEISLLAKPFGFKVTMGGETRTESVKRALAEVTGDIVLVHDGARPFVSRGLISSCISAVKKYGSAVCALPSTDTAALCGGENIEEYCNRSKLFMLQTPQGFYAADLRRAYGLAGGQNFTDDSAVYKKYIGSPHIIAGEKENIKLTYAEDFGREFPPLPSSLPSFQRIGFGADVHAFTAGNGVTLGGVKIPCDASLKAHSDGDVLFHAVTDALLSAAGLKDIGFYFPDSDEKYKGANSADMCATALKEVKKAGYAPVNISVTVQAEKPRLAAYADKIISNLAQVLETATENVAVAAGTCEKLGFVGEGLGIAAYAAVLLRKTDGGDKNG